MVSRVEGQALRIAAREWRAALVRARLRRVTGMAERLQVALIPWIATLDQADDVVDLGCLHDLAARTM